MKNIPVVPLVLGEYRGWLSRDFKSTRMLECLKNPNNLMNGPSSQVLLDGRNKVVKVEISSFKVKRIVVIKEYRTRGVDTLKSALLPSKAVRAWRGAAALVKRDVETPFPIAFFQSKKGPFVDRSFFISEWVEYYREIRELFQEKDEEKLRPLLVALSDFLCRCFNKNILHRDLSDGNILVKEQNGVYRFMMVDTNRIRVRRRIGWFRKVRSIIRLGIPSALQPFFMELCLGNGRGKKLYWLVYKMCKAFYSGRIAIKKKLRLKKIVRKMKIQ
ncbi:MAG: hypothetical protein JXB26_07045 [Candidatus Aminicenantes bacterium]|nr:hypothetical protein [Candidatus Aminicenantes bacterium]